MLLSYRYIKGEQKGKKEITSWRTQKANVRVLC